MSTNKTAKLWRMNTGEHICPYGLKSKDLLQQHGYTVEDHQLKTREEIDNFKDKHSLETTPQTWINDQRIGGYDALRAFLDLESVDNKGSKYAPIIAIFAMTALSAIAIQIANGSLFTWHTIVYFIALSMVVLAIQKLQDLDAFSMQFITYDLLAMKKLRYSYVYPFAEAYVGVGMLSGLSPWLFAPVGIFIGTVGAVSVIKAVYIDKRDLKCACTGGNSDVPLGFISLTENFFMIIAGIAMLNASL